MTVISETDKKAIKRFVQEVLGCTCPDEVFLNINLEKNPSNFADISQGDLIMIGGKLLVYLIKPNDGKVLVSKLEQLFIRGREMRDNGGFSRFRLVVLILGNPSVREILSQKFESLKNLDERVHLHVIEDDQLPSVIAQ